MPRIAIIGGGAAGMMVAATLVEKQLEKAENTSALDIHIFEKNKELGNKVRISGGGRCNITTGYYRKQDLQTKYTRGRDFLSHAISRFGPRKMAQRCADNGCPVYCQEDMRCFPASNKGSDVVAMFERILQTGNTHIHFNEPVSFIETGLSNITQQQAHIYTQENHNQTPLNRELPQSNFILTTPIDTYNFDFVVITTGGNAYGHTGSTGDGYDLATSFGHTITSIGPSLNSFLVQEDWIKACSGSSFTNATLWSIPTPLAEGSQDADENTSKTHKIHLEKPVLITTSGPILFTHFGISGPVTFSYSSHIPYVPVSTKAPHTLYCVPFADRNYEWWLQWLHDKTQQEGKKHLGTILGYEFSNRWVDAFLAFFEKDILTLSNNHSHHKHTLTETMIANLTKEQKKSLADLLGNGFPLTLIAHRPGDEFVTAGGVDTREVDPKTMQSLRCPGLYFAGEILNIDAVTGGFNFQSCRATGRCAGEEISKGI